eukprot:2279634-Pyramimonas_sp.AAC.1
MAPSIFKLSLPPGLTAAPQSGHVALHSPEDAAAMRVKSVRILSWHALEKTATSDVQRRVL